MSEAKQVEQQAKMQCYPAGYILKQVMAFFKPRSETFTYL